MLAALALAAVCLVGADHDIGAIRQRRKIGLVRRWGELLQGGKDHAARSAVAQGEQVLAVPRLRRCLAQQVEEAPLLEYALDRGGHLRQSLGLDACAVGGAPGHEAFAVRRQRAHPCGQAVGCHRQCIAAKQRRDQSRYGGGETRPGDDLVLGRPLRLPAIGADDVVRGTGEAQPGKLLQQRGFQLGFGEEGHQIPLAGVGSRWPMPWIRSIGSPSIRLLSAGRE